MIVNFNGTECSVDCFDDYLWDWERYVKSEYKNEAENLFLSQVENVSWADYRRFEVICPAEKTVSGADVIFYFLYEAEDEPRLYYSCNEIPILSKEINGITYEIGYIDEYLRDFERFVLPEFVGEAYSLVLDNLEKWMNEHQQYQSILVDAEKTIENETVEFLFYCINLIEYDGTYHFNYEVGIK